MSIVHLWSSENLWAQVENLEPHYFISSSFSFHSPFSLPPFSPLYFHPIKHWLRILDDCNPIVITF